MSTVKNSLLPTASQQTRTERLLLDGATIVFELSLKDRRKLGIGLPLAFPGEPFPVAVLRVGRGAMVIDPFCEKEDGAHQTPIIKQGTIFKRRKLNRWDQYQILSTATTLNIINSGMNKTKHKHLYVHKLEHSNNNTARVVVLFEKKFEFRTTEHQKAKHLC